VPGRDGTHLARRALGRSVAGRLLPRRVHATGTSCHVALQNKAALYGLLFQAASETMTIIAGDPRYLGVRIGITAVLHT
jgi:hypothetical protein